MTATASARVVKAGEGKRLSFPAGNWGEVKADQSSGMRFGFFVTELPVKTGMPFLHVHHSMDEAFQILEGKIEYRLGDKYMFANAGAAVIVPSGTPHCFRAVSEQGAKLILLAAPANGIDMVVELATATLSDTNRIISILKKYDTELLELRPNWPSDEY